MKKAIRFAMVISLLVGATGASFAQSRNTGEIRGTVMASGADCAKCNRHSHKY